MKPVLIFIICFTFIYIANANLDECVKSRKWQIGSTMYENVWLNGKLHVHARCNDSSLHLYGRDLSLCEKGKLPHGLPRCLQDETFHKCEFGNKWEDGITEYEIVKSGIDKFVRAKCSQEGFVIDRYKFPCYNVISNRALPSCRIGEVKNLFEACARGRQIRNENFHFQNVWRHGKLYVREYCFQGTSEARVDAILCKDGKIQSPICERRDYVTDICMPYKKWKANETEYEIFIYGHGLIVIGKCKDKGLQMESPSWKKCEGGKIPEKLPQCKARVLHPLPINHVANPEVRTTKAPSSTTINKFVNPSNRNNCILKNGGCNQICKPKNGTIECSCYQGYELQSDSKTCVDVDECASEKYGCSHFCVNKPGSAFCSCPKGFKLKADRKTCDDIDECSRKAFNKCDHLCNNINGNYTCSCNQGYILFNEYHCKDINECLSQNFGCSDVCVNTPGSAYCSCPDGFTLHSNRKHCIDIDECINHATNKCHHQCVNIKGSYKCSCQPGYVLINDFKCEGCRKNSYRSSVDTFCVDCPLNSHTESDSKSSIADCICNNGFYGNISNDEPCRDIDECDSSNFGCSDSCINTIGSAFCSCPLGYQLQEDQKTCSDINECHVKNGGCQDICHNFDGSFRCTCEEGYTVSTTDSYACDDINECLENNGGCSGQCVNFLGGYQCSCQEDSFLAEDEKTCLTSYCPEVPIPYHSRLQCFPKDNKTDKFLYYSQNATYSEKLPVGSVCKVKCNKGYAIKESSSEISCQKNGIWNDTLGECHVSQCPPLKPPENGDVHPSECKEGLMAVKEKCYFTCNEGYSMKENRTVFTCKNKLQWNYNKTPTCDPILIPPYVTCPSDVTLNLLPNENSTVIFVKYPKTNVEDIQISPYWVDFERNVSFPAGKTDIVLVANSPHFKNLTVNCTFSVIVLDSQSPEYLDCPETIRAIGSNVGGAVVYWEEPTAFDNVGIKSVSKSAEPNSTWFPGLHIVEYIAEDFAGNIARCSFEINVTSSECVDLKDPENGYANCQDWVYGKVCEPTCHANYTRRYNEDELYYFCDDNGVWTPSDVISPCLPECESEKNWSPELENCMDIPENTTDTSSV